jgi:hypothetical protein
MSIDEYLAALDAKLQELASVVVSIIMQREIDANVGIGFIKGRVIFLDGSQLEFSEQLPIARQKYRLHYMDSQSSLIVRWDSAPHYRMMQTFPFHQHTPQGGGEHVAMTLLAALAEIAKRLRID